MKKLWDGTSETRIQPWEKLKEPASGCTRLLRKLTEIISKTMEDPTHPSRSLFQKVFTMLMEGSDNCAGIIVAQSLISTKDLFSDTLNDTLLIMSKGIREQIESTLLNVIFEGFLMLEISVTYIRTDVISKSF